MFDFSHEEVKPAMVFSYSFCFLHTSGCMSLFASRNKERMIIIIEKKKRRKSEKIDSEIASSFEYSPSPPVHSTSFHAIRHFPSGTNPSPTFPPLLALIADPHQHGPGNPPFGRMSALHSPLPWQVKYAGDQIHPGLHGRATCPCKKPPSPEPTRPPGFQP